MNEFNLHTLIDQEEQGTTQDFDEVTPWPAEVDGVTLLEDLASVIKRYVICEDHIVDAAALWICMTWFIEAISVAPIANITAPAPNCGKSTLLEVFEHLTYRPLKADNVSSAALFRSIEKWRPTLLIDEVDTFLKENETARGILNCGYKRNGYVLRVVGKDHEPKKFNTWGAKALCGIGSIADTLRSRSIRLELRRKMIGENVENIRHIEPDLVQQLVQRLCRFSADMHSQVKNARPAIIPELCNRAQDNWEPLLAIAEAAGGNWRDRAVKAALAIANIDVSLGSPDLDMELLADVRTVFSSLQVSRISTSELINELCKDAEAPWATLNNGHAITARRLSTMLKSFGIKSGTIRIGEQTIKGFYLEKFQDCFDRYLPSTHPQPVTSSQASDTKACSDSDIRHTGEDVTDTKCEQSQ